MDVLFCIRALKLIVAICAAGFYTDPPHEEPTPVSAILHRNQEQRAASPGSFVYRRQPSVPIASTKQRIYSATDSFQNHPAVTQCVDDSHLPQTPSEMMPNKDTADAAPASSESNVFKYVNYFVMTPEYTFSSDERAPFLQCDAADTKSSAGDDLNGAGRRHCSHLSEQLPSSSAIPLTKLTRFVSDSAELNDADALASPETPLSKSLDAIVSRPMSAINLGAALSPVTSSGEPMQTPISSVETPGSRIIEQHYVATPHSFTHPSRDVFPFRHQPLYFEDPNMERCGSSDGCLTEFTSIAHFAIRIPLLPYLMASNSPHDCVRALPDCPTCCQFGPEAYIPRPTVKAVAVQAAATTGFIFLVP